MSKLEAKFLPALALSLLVISASVAEAQVPPGGTSPAGRGGGGGRGRGAVQVMTLTTTAFNDGGTIPTKYTQVGEEASPPLAWSAPDSAASFVLIVHDPNAATGNGLDDVLHWMVWNIPGSARALPEGIPHGATLTGGSTRQISVSGPYFRGAAAPASGPPHHYVFELYALDTTLDVPAVGQSPAATRAAVVAAMAGHVRGKAVLVGVFKRAAP